MNSLISELSKQYKIAPSTLYKIQKLSKKDVIKLPRRSYQCATLNTQNKAKRIIDKFYHSANTPFTVDDIQK